MIMNSTEINDTLELLGFTQKSYVETILVTLNQNRTFIPAPIGVIRQGNQLIVRPFKSNNTYKNLTNTTRTSINITDNPLLFLKTAFIDEFDHVPAVLNWILEGSHATILTDKISEEAYSDIQASFTLKPITLSINYKMPTVFSRGRAEAIEAIIHATRIKVFQTENKVNKVKELVEKMRASFNIITPKYSLSHW